MISVSFASDLLKEWRDFFWTNHRAECSKTSAILVYFRLSIKNFSKLPELFWTRWYISTTKLKLFQFSNRIIWEEKNIPLRETEKRDLPPRKIFRLCHSDLGKLAISPSSIWNFSSSPWQYNYKLPVFNLKKYSGMFETVNAPKIRLVFQIIYPD